MIAIKIDYGISEFARSQRTSEKKIHVAKYYTFSLERKTQGRESISLYFICSLSLRLCNSLVARGKQTQPLNSVGSL